ncbi:chorismate mutase [Grosmannia clavigera kw1407]|uniref:Chorismate mutase n=1 Tax=Grosmannia clavigera (strain kw1407 / UAMH 11150) TaxID=655863 RepID=F0XGN4_GROCL|nr:chorismate mutase [Grosmannia clavigera kw1407]EFX03086.1 chorismate mutase [Grosmannia clavigera kw1407]
MDSAIDMLDSSLALDLSRIRVQLIRLEDSITFHLIERAQFPLNKSIYEPGAVPIRDSLLPWPWTRPLFGKTYSFMDWYLRQQERLQSRIRRFESPDENAFFPDAVVGRPILRPLDYPAILHPNDVVVNDEIKAYYVHKLLPAVCPDLGHGDRGEVQENYGSSATCDIAVLQALSRRIHFGKFVAESKFRAETDRFTRLIRASDRDGIGEAIVNKRVEQLVLQRMRNKVETFGQDIAADGATGAPNKINVDAVVALYEDFVIPLTKVVEVEYLMQRLDDVHIPWYKNLPRPIAIDPSQAALLCGMGLGGTIVVVAAAALRWLPLRR